MTNLLLLSDHALKRLFINIKYKFFTHKTCPLECPSCIPDRNPRHARGTKHGEKDIKANSYLRTSLEHFIDLMTMFMRRIDTL